MKKSLLTLLLAVGLSIAMAPQTALSGMCSSAPFCCDDSDQCWEGTCLAYSGMCTGSNLGEDVIYYCNTDADCQEGHSCLPVGGCDGDPTSGCWDTDEQVGSCDPSPIVCLTDAHCPPTESCFLLGDVCDGAPCDPTMCETLVPFEYSEPTTPGDPVVIAPDGTTISFGEVTSSGETTVDKLLGTPAIPGNFYLLNDPTFVYDIETTAVFVPPIEVCIPYDEPDPSIDETSIRLMHEEGSTYVDRTTSLDTVNNIVCAEVDSLSAFVVASSEGSTSGWGAGSTTGVEYGPSSRNLNYVLFLLAPICAILVLRLRKKM